MKSLNKNNLIKKTLESVFYEGGTVDIDELKNFRIDLIELLKKYGEVNGKNIEMNATHLCDGRVILNIKLVVDEFFEKSYF